MGPPVTQARSTARRPQPSSASPAIAVSLQTRYDWPAGARAAAPSAAQYTVHLVQRIQNAAGNGPLMPQGTTVNVNLPLLPGTADPATGEPTSALPPKGTDVRAVNDGYVSLTPLELDRDVDESTAAWLRSVLRRGETN